MDHGAAPVDDADLNGFVDGRLEPARMAVIAAILATDREARARIEGWKRQNEALRAMFSAVLFEPVPVRLLPTTLPKEPAATEGPPARRSAADPRPAAAPGRIPGVMIVVSIGVALVAFAAGALASLGPDGFGLAVLDRPGRPAPVSVTPLAQTLATRAAEAHDAYLVDRTLEVEIPASEPSRLRRLILNGLAAPFRIPDLSRLGWKLVGGRLLPGPNGPAGFLVYGAGGDRLALYVSRLQGTAFDATSSTGDRPATVVAWGDGSFGYAFTTTRDAGWLERNVASLREAVGGGSDAPGSPP